MERETAAGAVFESDHRASTVLRQHRHSGSFATIVLRGSYVEVCDAVPTLCRAGSIVVHGADERHADRFADDTLCLNVEIPDARASGRGCDAPPVAETPLHDAAHDVVRSFYEGSRGLRGAVESFQSALAAQTRQADRDGPGWLREALDTFPWAQAVPLRLAAKAAGVHEVHFSRAFRRHVGMTAQRFRTRARIRLASRLMLTTTDSLARVSLTSGFSDQSHFTRTFTRELGLTPAGYRRAFTR